MLRVVEGGGDPIQVCSSGTAGDTGVKCNAINGGPKFLPNNRPLYPKYPGLVFFELKSLCFVPVMYNTPSYFGTILCFISFTFNTTTLRVHLLQAVV